MDGEPSPPAIVSPAAPTHGQAATELYGRTPHEVELCRQASTPAYGYALGWLALTGLGFAVGSATKYAESEGVRYLGPITLSVAWGGLVGSTYASMPKCHEYFAGGAPPEGAVHTSIPIAVSLAMLAGATAPIMVGINTGFLPLSWSTEERAGRLIASGVLGFFSALLPYVPFLAPRTLRAARELERLRVQPAESGLVIGFAGRF